MSYLQLKHFCVKCGSHFVVCTNHPKEFNLNRTFCPQCGQQGTSIRHTERVDGEIEDLVPGNSPFEGAGCHINPVYFEECEPKDYLLPTKDSSRRRLVDKLEAAHERGTLKPVNPLAQPKEEKVRVKKK